MIIRLSATRRQLELALMAITDWDTSDLDLDGDDLETLLHLQQNIRGAIA